MAVLSNVELDKFRMWYAEGDTATAPAQTTTVLSSSQMKFCSFLSSLIAQDGLMLRQFSLRSLHHLFPDIFERFRLLTIQRIVFCALLRSTPRRVTYVGGTPFLHVTPRKSFPKRCKIAPRLQLKHRQMKDVLKVPGQRFGNKIKIRLRNIKNK